jgi:hypothetical protein
MIESVERYRRVCAQITYFSDRAGNSFNLFIKLTIATIGGFAWLKTHNDLDQLSGLVRWIVPALALITACEILTDLTSWWGYREAEAQLLDMPELQPKCFKSGLRDFIRIVVLMIVGVAGFFWLR